MNENNNRELSELQEKLNSLQAKLKECEDARDYWSNQYSRLLAANTSLKKVVKELANSL